MAGINHEKKGHHCGHVAAPGLAPGDTTPAIAMAVAMATVSAGGARP